jgi:hypothetical protein
VRAGTPHRRAHCAGGAGLASSQGLADGCSEAELLLYATGGAGEEQANRSGAPVGASAAWDSDCGLSNWSGVISGAAGGACSLCSEETFSDFINISFIFFQFFNPRI